MEFVSLDEFHRRKLRPSESVSIYVHDLKKLLDQAMPGLEKVTRDQLLLHQILAGLLEAVSRQLRATGETKKLGSTIERARLLMTIEGGGQTASISRKEAVPSEVESLQEQVTALTEQVSALSTRSTRFVQDRRQQRPRH